MHRRQILFAFIFSRHVVCVFLMTGSLSASPSGSSTIDSLKGISEDSPHFSEAQQRLAEIYLEENTVLSRRAAVTCIGKALAQNPDNLDYNLTHVKILYEQGFYIATADACDRILAAQIHSGREYNRYFAEAYYYKGLIAERDALKYKDMISFVESLSSNTYVSLSNYGIDDMKSAAACYEKCLQYQMKHRDALFHLALLYMEIQSYERMAKLFDLTIESDRGDKDAFVYGALAYYHLGQTERAGAYYQKAFGLMTKEERDMYHAIEYVVPPGELDTFKKKKKAQESGSYEDHFWRKKDPLYLTTTNERQIEHYNRVAYANLRYSVPKQHLPGWKTERGKIYIRYGKPPVFYSVQPDIGLLGGAQMWQYPDFGFYFRDENSNGNFLMDDASLLEARSAYHTAEELFELPRAFPMQAQVYQFKGRDGQTKLRAYFAAGLDDKEYETFGMDVRADEGLFLLNADGAIVSESRVPVKLNREDRYGDQFIRSLELDGLSARSSVASYSLELRTLGEWRTAVSRDQIQIKDFSHDTLQLSDVIVASDHRGENIIPYFTREISRTHDIYLYFEIYNLSTDDALKSHYTISTGIQPQIRRGVSKLLHTIFGNENKITSTFEAAGNGRDDRYSFAINMTDVPKGKVDLVIQVTDTGTGKSVTQTIPLTITD